MAALGNPQPERHAADAAERLVNIPAAVFLHDEELIGYTAIKGHWLDIAAKDPYWATQVDI